MLYRLHKVWTAAHNKDYPQHTLIEDDITDWDISKPCLAKNCPADMTSYFRDSKLWIDGDAIAGSIQATRRLIKSGHELVVISAVANPLAAKPSLDWLQICFPHIPDVMMVSSGGLKSWVMGDILIDDAPQNHRGFQGISILFDQPWNRTNKQLIRAQDWNHAEAIINRAELYIDHYQNAAAEDAHELWAHKYIEKRLKLEVEEGII